MDGDSTTMIRTYVNTDYFPTEPFEGHRMLSYKDRLIYKFDGKMWVTSICNRTCMRYIEVAILEDGRVEFI